MLGAGMPWLNVTFASAGSCPISAGGSSTGPEETPSGKSPADNMTPACHCVYRPQHPMHGITEFACRAELARSGFMAYGVIGDSNHWHCALS